MAPNTTPWDFEKIEELKRLWAEGYSGTDIADKLGEGFTRCAVLGKLSRLGLQRQKPRQALRPKVRRRRAVFIRPPEPPKPPPPVRLEPPPPRMRKLRLLQLADHHCRWPIGDPRSRTFCFCAADCESGQVYCPYHMAKAFAKSRGPR